jgi:hypothetical protein
MWGIVNLLPIVNRPGRYPLIVEADSQPHFRAQHQRLFMIVSAGKQFFNGRIT